MLEKIKHILFRGYEWNRSGHEQTDQSKTIKAGDVVECAIENTDGILYRVEAIDFAASEARVRRLAGDGKSDTQEIYTLAPVMIRPLRPAKK
jgi:hypothetical protein